MAETVQTATKDYIEQSEDRKISIGLAIGKHYRDRNSTRHAVKKLWKDYYEIHYDLENPHKDFMGHMVKDTPWLVAAIALGGAVGLYNWARR